LNAATIKLKKEKVLRKKIKKKKTKRNEKKGGKLGVGIDVGQIEG